ncbi:hypothetical protein [Aeromonas hydrophila]|uniref:hypothetical protein n=1 Tax=Aeromonas hydrophila TaxID=644 RepID=UPI00068D28FA|nr:hypothetical protein [Aeromonas hydrophila]
MPPEIDIGRLIWVIVGLLTAFGGGLAALVRWSIRQFEARLAATHKAQGEQTVLLGKQIEELGRKREELAGKMRERIGGVEDRQRDQEREFMELKLELAHDYVRREDFVRNQTVIEAKIDGLASKLEVYQLRGGAKHD